MFFKLTHYLLPAFCTQYVFSISMLVGIGIVLFALAAWRSLSKGDFAVLWALVAAIFAPLVGNGPVAFDHLGGLSMGVARSRYGWVHGLLG